MHLGSAGALEPIPTVPRDNLSCWEFESSMWIFHCVGWVGVPDPVLFKGHSVGLCLFSSPTPMPAIPPPHPRENRPPAGALEALGCRYGFVTPPLPGCLQLRTQPSGGLLLTLPHSLFGGDCPRPRVLHPSIPPPRAGPEHSV